MLGTATMQGWGKWLCVSLTVSSLAYAMGEPTAQETRQVSGEAMGFGEDSDEIEQSQIESTAAGDEDDSSEEEIPPRPEITRPQPSSEMVESVELAPDSVQLVVDLETKPRETLARHHKMFVGVEADLLSIGRVSLALGSKLSRIISLSGVLSMDYSEISAYHHLKKAVNGGRLPQTFAVSFGPLLKVRLSEWSLKSSVFLEPGLRFGYTRYTTSIVEPHNTFSLRPSLALGFQRVYNTGFTWDFKVGVERPVDFPKGPVQQGIAAAGILPFVSVGLGYSW